MNSARDVLEHTISPWLRILTPVVMGLILFILSGIDGELKEIATQVNAVRVDISSHGERITAVETAVEIHHGRGRPGD